MKTWELANLCATELAMLRGPLRRGFARIRCHRNFPSRSCTTQVWLSDMPSNTGFKVNSGEYKLMGLAPYDEPKYAGLILDRLIDLKPDGSFRLDLDYFDYCAGLRMTNTSFDELFGGPPAGRTSS